MSLSAGDRLGPYVIEAPIGSGGMGEVYRARDTRHDRAVAVTGELTGMIASIAHLAYHLGAIRQINKKVRGPKEGTFN